MAQSKADSKHLLLRAEKESGGYYFPQQTTCNCRCSRRLLTVNLVFCVLTWFLVIACIGYCSWAVHQVSPLPSSVCAETQNLQDLVSSVITNSAQQEDEAEIGFGDTEDIERDEESSIEDSDYEIAVDEWDSQELELLEGSGMQLERNVRSAEESSTKKPSTRQRRKDRHRRRKGRGGKGKKGRNNGKRGGSTTEASSTQNLRAAHYPGEISEDEMDRLIPHYDMHVLQEHCKYIDDLEGTLCRNGTFFPNSEKPIRIFRDTTLGDISPFIMEGGGRFKVQKKGILLVYAQATFEEKTLNGMRVEQMRGNVPVQMLVSKQNGAVPSSVVGLFAVEEGDWFQLVSSYEYSGVRVAPGVSFFGAVQLT